MSVSRKMSDRTFEVSYRISMAHFCVVSTVYSGNVLFYNKYTVLKENSAPCFHSDDLNIEIYLYSCLM